MAICFAYVILKKNSLYNYSIEGYHKRVVFHIITSGGYVKWHIRIFVVIKQYMETVLINYRNKW